MLEENKKDKTLVPSYWNLSELPFENNNDLRFAFASAEGTKLKQLLLSEISQKNRIIFLQGERGSGKSYLCSLLMNELPAEQYRTATVPPGAYPGLKLLQTIISQLNKSLYLQDDFYKYTGAFTEVLEANARGEKKNILIVFDNADMIKELEDYRRSFWAIVKHATAVNSYLKLIITGKSGLKEKLERTFMMTPAFVQYYVNPLNEKETTEYAAHRLALAGGDLNKIFTPGAVQSFYRYTYGLPRRINELGQRSLVQGVLKKTRTINEKILEECSSEMKASKKPLGKALMETFFREDIKDLLDKEPSKLLYDEIVAISEKIFSLRGEKVFLLDLDSVKTAVKRLIDHIKSGDEQIIILAKKNTFNSNYLPIHSVNVCILAIRLGLSINYHPEKLYELAMAAFLHDIGMIDIMDIVYKSDKLKDDEFKFIRQHPEKGGDMLKKLKAFYAYEELDPAAVARHHERLDGTGYPSGMNGRENLGEYAQIIGLIDVYEALTHPRAHRKDMTPQQALAIILEEENSKFETFFINALINELGYYFKNMLVKLDTGETAKVIETSEENPSKPKIEMLFDKDNNRLENRVIDLASTPGVGIVKIVE